MGIMRVQFSKNTIILRTSTIFCNAKVASQLSPLFYNYIVLRAGLLNNLLYIYHNSIWEHGIDKAAINFFKDCCIYIGKGKGTRKFHHFKENKCNLSAVQNEIKKEWNEGGGIILLHMHPEVNHFEAHCREYALIKAVGLNNLCNNYNGVPFGEMNNWSMNDIITYGNALLHNALVMCINDPPDVIMSYHSF